MYYSVSVSHCIVTLLSAVLSVYSVHCVPHAMSGLITMRANCTGPQLQQWLADFYAGWSDIDQRGLRLWESMSQKSGLPLHLDEPSGWLNQNRWPNFWGSLFCSYLTSKLI